MPCGSHWKKYFPEPQINFFLTLALVLEAYLEPGRREAGCDEAGRGCLAGPVFAAAVILPPDFHHPGLNDSKKLNEKKRDQLRLEIEREALAYAVASCSPEEIDQLNILQASITAMHRALSQLSPEAEFILVDGNRFRKYREVPHQTIVKGDEKFMSIAAASILAKTYRDECMMQLHEAFPEFAWNINKGYPTPHHRDYLLRHGPTPHHRRTFVLKNQQFSLSF